MHEEQYIHQLELFPELRKENEKMSSATATQETAAPEAIRSGLPPRNLLELTGLAGIQARVYA